MARQLSFAETEFTKGMHKSRKGKFLEEMEKIVPWPELAAYMKCALANLYQFRKKLLQGA